MAVKMTIWERILRLLMTEKSYVLRRLQMQTNELESNVQRFSSEVSGTELAIVGVVEDLRETQGRQVKSEDRHMQVTVKIEGLRDEFQLLQDKRKHEQASLKASLLEELVEEQVALETSMAENTERIKKQENNVRNLRRELTSMKSKLRKEEDNKNDILARYKMVQAMDKAQATMALLESDDHTQNVAGLTSTIRSKEAIVQGRREVLEASEDRQFEKLEQEMAVSDRVNQYINPVKGIQ